MRLIDADAVMKELDEYIDDCELGISDIKELINSASTVAYPFEKFRTLFCGTCQAYMRIEPERPQGEWKEHKLRNDIVVEYAFKCSNCKKDSGLVYRTDFCPNCGADMRDKKMKAKTNYKGEFENV